MDANLEWRIITIPSVLNFSCRKRINFQLILTSEHDIVRMYRLSKTYYSKLSCMIHECSV